MTKLKIPKIQLKILLDLEGDLSLKDISVRGKYITLQTLHADIEGLNTLSESLTIVGSSESDQVLIKKSILTTELFSCENHLTLKCSSVYCIDEPKATDVLRAKLKLSADSILSLEASRRLSMGVLSLRAVMKLRNSTVFSKEIILWNTIAIIDLDASTLHVKKEFSSRRIRVSLKNQSQIVTGNISLSDRNIEDTSVLQVNSLFRSDDRQAQSSDSVQEAVAQPMPAR